MKTNDIFSKFQSNNSKLEAVLYKKRLAGDVKNLLLSMLYNIGNSYNDYAGIKVNVEEKNKFIQNIINIIDSCNKIELVRPSSEEGQEFIKQGITSKANTYFKDIKAFPSEKAMLYALFKVSEKKMYLDEKHNLIRVSLPEMLNEGRDINNIEIIRDFNSWSWNTISSEISNIDCNLIYQNLQILLGFDFLEEWMNQENQPELLNKLEAELKRRYDDETVSQLLDLIYRLSVIVCIKRNKNERDRLTEEKEWDEKELERLKDKVGLVEELTKTKKLKAREIKKLDKIINSGELLQKEFDKRNKKLSEYKKIFSTENLKGTLKKERKKALNEINEANKLLDAKFYVKRKKELEESVKMLKEINKVKYKEKYKIDIQKLFIKCLDERVDKIELPSDKKEGIELFRTLRYYNFILFDDNRFIKDMDELKDELQKIKWKMVSKLYEIKALNPITKDTATDIGIVKPIFDTRIMDLGNTNVYAEQKGDEIIVEVYDGNILELEFAIENLNGVNFKKRKIKLFNNR